MAQTLRKKFKRVLKNREIKIRDMCIIVSEYLKELSGLHISPLEINEESGRKDLLHNFYLARAYYGKELGIDLPGLKETLPDSAPNGAYITKTDYTVHYYHDEFDGWNELKTPLEPGYTNTFKYENCLIENSVKEAGKDLIEGLNILENSVRWKEENKKES